MNQPSSVFLSLIGGIGTSKRLANSPKDTCDNGRSWNLSQVSRQSLRFQQTLHPCHHGLDWTPLAGGTSVSHLFSQTLATPILHTEHLSCHGRDPMTLLSPGAAPVTSPILHLSRAPACLSLHFH